MYSLSMRALLRKLVLHFSLLALCASPVAVAADAPASAKFGFKNVEAEARRLAAYPYVANDREIPKFFGELNYDQYRDLRFRKDKALWRNLENVPFQVEFFHLGFFFKRRVDIFEIVDGEVRPFRYTSENFDTGKLEVPADEATKLDGYAGFRVHAPVNRPEYYDEFLVFQGASYFRAIARNQAYGLSARGLAIDTVQPTGEEFPIFDQFWLVRPKPGDNALTVYALLNSPSVTGAYRFLITPGNTTVTEVQSTLFLRKPVKFLGIAPFSSMYWYGDPSFPKPFDFRPKVHDSEGLLIAHKSGKYIWRPIQLGRNIRHCAFWSGDLAGFGLVQRDRDFDHYLDLEARYHERPSVWVEPVGDWGSGCVNLIEIPTNDETFDNVVACWVPEKAPVVGEPIHFAYRIIWLSNPPEPTSVSRVLSTRTGHAHKSTDTMFIVEFSRYVAMKFPTDERGEPVLPKVVAECTPGATIKDTMIIKNPENGNWRVALRVAFEPKAEAVEFNCKLVHNNKTISEVWNYLWKP